MTWRALFLFVFIQAGVSVSGFGVTFGLVGSIGPEVVKSLMCKQKTSTRVRMDNLMSALSKEITKEMPQSVKTSPIDRSLDMGMGYICSSTGILSGLNTMKKTDMIGFSRNEDGTTNITVKYHFDSLKLLYEKFVYKYLMSTEMKLELNYLKNTLVVELKIEKISSIVMRVIRRNCVMHVVKIDLVELGEFQLDVRNPTTRENVRLLKSIMEQIIKRNQETVRNCMNERINVEISNALRSSGSFLCKSDTLHNLVLDKYAPQVTKLPKSPEYYKLCG